MESLIKRDIQNHLIYHDMGLVKTSMTNRKSSYTVVSIQESDTERVIDFLKRFFFRDEPLNLCIDLLNGGDTCLELEKFCTEPIPEGLSLMAVTPADEIIGVCLNAEVGSHEEEAECQNEKFNKIGTLLERVSNETDVFKRFPGVRKALDIKVASVHADYRGLGIAKALFEATRRMAKERGFQLVKVDCSSHFTALAVAKLGFHCIYKLDYKDHLGEDGKPVFTPEKPHTSITTYVYHIE